MGTSLLLDTDILIDWLHGRAWTKTLLSHSDLVCYYSSLTKKELLSKPGLPTTERKKIIWLLKHLRLIPLTPDIAEKAFDLLKRYSKKGLGKNDAIIAATAWSKKIILLTRNWKHFEFIREINLAQKKSGHTSLEEGDLNF